MTPGTPLLIVERDLGRPNERADAKFIDLTMLVATGGRERTVDDYAALVEATRFRFVGVTPSAMCDRRPRGQTWSQITTEPVEKSERIEASTTSLRAPCRSSGLGAVQVWTAEIPPPRRTDSRPAQRPGAETPF
jgi:hypothetical protein